MKIKNIPTKKGVAYTLAAISLVIVALIAFASKTQFKERNSVLVAETRIETMNDFMKDVEKDLTRGMNIASYRALLAILQTETAKGSFVADSRAAFAEAFLNGSINNTQMNIIQNASLSNWTQRIKAQAEKIGIGVDFNVESLSVEHVAPWDISVNTTIIINLSDSKNTARWVTKKNISSVVNIKGLEDPVYIIKTYGKISNIVAENNFGFSNLSNLEKHINNSLYIPSTTAPSYLMRLQGDLSASNNGIESIVNLNELSQQSLQLLTRSNVDYIYFGNQTHSSCQINQTKNGNFSFFRLDNGVEPLNHLDNYNAVCAG